MKNNLLKAARVVRGLRQRDLADMTGVSVVRICRIERGTFFPIRPREAEAIGEILGLSAESLCGHKHETGK